MIPLTPALLVAAANAFVGRGHGPDAGDSEVVELFLYDPAQGREACRQTAFIDHVGYWSHYDDDVQMSSWPMPATVTCQQIADFARRWEILMKEPHVGDVFLLYSAPSREYAHAGIVVSVNEKFGHDDHSAFICTTVEGGTDEDPRGRGLDAFRKVRWFSIGNGDRFVRWVDLELRAVAA